MTDETKQAVADGADAQKPAETEAVGAQAEQPDLDSLLDAFGKDDSDSGARSEPSQRAAAEQTDLAKALADVQRELSEVKGRLATQDFDTEFNRAADSLSDGLDVDPEVFKNTLYGRVARDPRLAEAYENRSRNPGAWRQVEQALKTEFASKFPAKSKEDIDDGMTRDREALTAAVRGEPSTRSRNGKRGDTVGDYSDPDNVAGMSDEEFAAYQMERGANPYG